MPFFWGGFYDIFFPQICFHLRGILAGALSESKMLKMSGHAREPQKLGTLHREAGSRLIARCRCPRFCFTWGRVKVVSARRRSRRCSTTHIGSPCTSLRHSRFKVPMHQSSSFKVQGRAPGHAGPGWAANIFAFGGLKKGGGTPQDH